ncbi:MAG: ABC transporter ATP-binding protein [Bacilli bacterium]
MLQLTHLSKSFRNHRVLHDISLSMQDGEFIALLGPSGCGKTTLLRIIAGLETHDEGKISFQNESLDLVPAGARGFGFVFQSYALFPNLTAADNISYGLKGTKQQRATDTTHMLTLVELNEHQHKYPNELSGGQQQRVALARAVVTQPKLLLLDEPLGALDAKVREKLRGELKRLQRTLGIPTILVTHDQEEALTLCDRVAVMNEGRIQQFATPRDIYTRPATLWVASFIGTMNCSEPTDSAITYAIRPEHVAFTEADTGILGRIVDHEFRGNVVRYTVSLFGNMYGFQTMVVDEWQGYMSVERSGTVRVNIAPEHLLTYRGEELVHVSTEHVSV